MSEIEQLQARIRELEARAADAERLEGMAREQTTLFMARAGVFCQRLQPQGTWTCPRCGGCQWEYSAFPECSTRYCADCSEAYRPSEAGYPMDRVAELEAHAAGMRALLEPMLQPDIWWCPQCKMTTGATYEERCVTCGHVFADNPPADAIRAALSPDAGRRMAEVVEAARRLRESLPIGESLGMIVEYADANDQLVALYDKLAALDAEGGAS